MTELIEYVVYDGWVPLSIVVAAAGSQLVRFRPKRKDPAQHTRQHHSDERKRDHE